jgi:hypothetical protein
MDGATLIDALRTASNVATPIGALCFIATLFLAGFWLALRHWQAQLQAIPPEERARNVDTYLTRYGLNIANLTRADKIALLNKEMDQRQSAAGRRAQTFRIGWISGLCACVVCVAIVIWAHAKGVGPRVFVQLVPKGDAKPTGEFTLTYLRPGFDSGTATGTAGKVTINDLPPSDKLRVVPPFKYSGFQITDKKTDDVWVLPIDDNVRWTPNTGPENALY